MSQTVNYIVLFQNCWTRQSFYNHLSLSMSKVYQTEFSDEEQQYLLSKLFRFIVTDGCHLWYGDSNQDGYGIIRPLFRNKKQTFTVHRLQYFLANNCKFSNPNYHVSHLCHNKKCINIEHLSFEPAEINVARNHCKRTKTCYGHDGFKNCILR